jgi:hypothetical protein
MDAPIADDIRCQHAASSFSGHFGASPHSYASSEMLLLAAHSLGNVGLSDQFVLSQVVNCH